MNVTSIGDLAQSLMLRARNAQLKSTIAVLAQELSSGQTNNLSSRMGGDLSHLTDIEHNLTRLQGYAIATNEAAAFTQSMQINLDHIDDTFGMVGSALLGINQQADRSHATVRARQGLDTVVESLNSRSAGRSLFAGIASDRTPLLSSQLLVKSLRSVLTGLTTIADIEQAARAWFDDPAGFQTVMYAGANEPLAPFEIGPGKRVSTPLRADDPIFRDALRQLTTAAIADDPTLGLSAETKHELLQRAGIEILNGQYALTQARADLGFVQSQIEETAARNSATISSLEYARNELLSVDPYETATRLEEIQFQLESLYSVTVRAARLSLLAFLK
ncbi:flagellin [Pontibaca salina]|uniref:Flagellar biosynthesis protein FlgL n=1 Tax=Pontibaca salina TaxID=2795731 RepID=A0A934HP99_9RHOB|nr:flagellin [Pontibaca salina]MBI6628476.1 flagellar biosynthesis protein FlgL [Pontibaca salina]